MSTRKLIALAALFLLPNLAPATNGYFSHGVGIKSKGMGGAGIALSGDAMAGGGNPAAFAFQRRNVEMGLDMFRPDRGGAIVGNGMFGHDKEFDGNGSASFFIPEFGLAWPLNPRFAWGLSVYGNGGMNTSYTDAIGLFGTSKAGVNLSQLFVSPAFALLIAPGQALGITFNYAWQSFEANGLENFTSMSGAPDHVTNNGASRSTGVGFRVGYLGRLSGSLSVGAAYQGKTNMSEFGEYEGLFAESGDFDIPSNMTAGFAYEAGPATLAFDWTRINYGEVAAIAHSGALQMPLGDAEGPGFGWTDMDVYKLGLVYSARKNLQLRAGFNHGAQPIPAGETLFNMLAPGVVENHYTLGGTWTTPRGCELTLGLMIAPEITVDGLHSISPGNPPDGMGGGEANLHMSQTSLGLGFEKPF